MISVGLKLLFVRHIPESGIAVEAEPVKSQEPVLNEFVSVEESLLTKSKEPIWALTNDATFDWGLNDVDMLGLWPLVLAQSLIASVLKDAFEKLISACEFEYTTDELDSISISILMISRVSSAWLMIH